MFDLQVLLGILGLLDGFLRFLISLLPGMMSAKSLMLYALLIAEAKKPPKGATRDAKEPWGSRFLGLLGV